VTTLFTFADGFHASATAQYDCKCEYALVHHSFCMSCTWTDRYVFSLHNYLPFLHSVIPFTSVIAVAPKCKSSVDESVSKRKKIVMKHIEKIKNELYCFSISCNILGVT
jgi:hypothetical protein